MHVSISISAVYKRTAYLFIYLSLIPVVLFVYSIISNNLNIELILFTSCCCICSLATINLWYQIQKIAWFTIQTETQWLNSTAKTLQSVPLLHQILQKIY